MSIKKWLTFLLVAVLLVSLVVGCTPTDPTEHPENGQPDGEEGEEGGEKVVVYGLTNSWNRLMPYDMGSMFSIIPNDKIFDGLANFDNENIIAMRAAKSMESADDGKTIIIHLREESLWHDGEKVTAYDWEWTIKTMVQKPFEGLATRSYLSPLAGTDASGTVIDGEEVGVEALDEYTLALYLKEPTTPTAFLGTYSYYYRVLPKHLLEDIPVEELNEHEFWNNPIGSGPCKFVSEVTGTELVLEAFDDYYLGRPEFDKLIYRVISDTSVSAGFLSGEFDAAWDTVEPEEALSLDGQNGLHADKMENTIVMFLALNNEKFPPEVRKAFDLLIDKELIVKEILKGHGEVAVSPTLPTSRYYNSDLVHERDVEKAKQMLIDAGFDFNATYNIAAANTQRQNISVIIQQNFAEAGINLEILNCDSTTLITNLRSGEFDMGIMQGTVPANPTWFIFQVNPAGVTYARVQDSKYYDKYVDANMAATDEERVQIMQEVQEVMFEECPYIFLCHKDIYMVLSEKLANLTVPNNDTCWEWKVK
ncbi:MAG: ABC transporter substrate-binding protein [Dethiobacteria bacterium]|nr:ABC transporter substrate-binding protein [Bacillota bacterium]